MTLLPKTSHSLMGRWSLESYENFQPSGSVLITEGQIGSLEYTADGMVRVSIRRDEKRLEFLGLSAELGKITYGGRYEMDETTQTVYHHIEYANDPKRIGKTLTRQYCVDGNMLEITGTGLDGKVKLIWARER